MASTSETRLSLRGITKRYGSLVAVDGIDLDVEPGEFVVIVGPSGCGKSTTLRMIAGLEEITDGDLYFDENQMNHVEPQNRNVAMVFQNYALYPHMTARRNMTFGMNSGEQSYTSEEIENRVRSAAEMLGIADLLDRKPKHLSGGERQRVALGRALVRDPDILLLDEPLSNLDAKLRTEMRTELAELHQRLGTTTVYVTHDQTEAMTLGDKVVVMDDGELQQIDPPQRLYDFPANRFVASFIGSPSVNLIPVTVESDGEDYVIEAEHAKQDFRIELPRTGDFETLEEGPATFGIRPEDIHLERTVDYDHEVPLSLTVDVTEPLGNTLLVHGTIGDQEIRVLLDPHLKVDEGDELALVCDPDRLHLFDDASGEAIYHSTEQAARELHA